MLSSLFDSPFKEISVNTPGAVQPQVCVSALRSNAMRTLPHALSTSRGYTQDAVTLHAYDQELFDFSGVFDYDLPDAAGFPDQNLLPRADQNLLPAKKNNRYKPVAQQQLERQQARDQLLVDTMTAAAVYRDSTVSPVAAVWMHPWQPIRSHHCSCVHAHPGTVWGVVHPPPRN